MKPIQPFLDGSTQKNLLRSASWASIQHKYEMQEHVISPRASLIEAAAQDIEQRIDPNIYAVCTLKQAVPCGNQLVRGDLVQYAVEAARFIRRLSKRVYGKSNYARTKKELPAAVTLEGDGNNRRFHFNVLIRKPDWISHADFKAVFIKEWSRMQWGRNDVYFEERYDDCVRYSLKEGANSLIYQTR